MDKGDESGRRDATAKRDELIGVDAKMFADGWEERMGEVVRGQLKSLAATARELAARCGCDICVQAAIDISIAERAIDEPAAEGENSKGAPADHWENPLGTPPDDPTSRKMGLLASMLRAEREREMLRFRRVVAGLVSVSDGNPKVEALARAFFEAHQTFSIGAGYAMPNEGFTSWSELHWEDRDLLIATCADLLARGIISWTGEAPAPQGAKNLPVGSIVADDQGAWMKKHPDHWGGTWVFDEIGDDEMDLEIARGAKVLRVGTGES